MTEPSACLPLDWMKPLGFIYIHYGGPVEQHGWSDQVLMHWSRSSTAGMGCNYYSLHFVLPLAGWLRGVETGWWLVGKPGLVDQLWRFPLL